MLESSQKRKNNSEPAPRGVKKARMDPEIIDLTWLDETLLRAKSDSAAWPTQVGILLISLLNPR